MKRREYGSRQAKVQLFEWIEFVQDDRSRQTRCLPDRLHLESWNRDSLLQPHRELQEEEVLERCEQSDVSGRLTTSIPEEKIGIRVDQ